MFYCLYGTANPRFIYLLGGFSGDDAEMNKLPVKPSNRAASPGMSVESPTEDRGTISGTTFHYLPLSYDLLNSGTYVTSTGRSRIAAGEAYPPARHPSLYHFNWMDGRVLPEFGLILITAGSGTFESRPTGVVPIAPGNAFLLFPGVWHRYCPNRNVGWDEKWVQFNGELPHKLFQEGLLSPERPILHPTGMPQIEGALDRLFAEVHRNPSTNSIYVSLLALAAVTAAVERESVRWTQAKLPGRRVANDPLVASAIDYIWTRSHAVLSVEDVAANVSLGRRSLERRMVKIVGHSVLDEIIHCRFSRAERLLRETELPIKVVVSLSGFGSMQNMRHIFLKRTGVSPSEYRIRCRSRFSQPERPAPGSTRRCPDGSP